MAFVRDDQVQEKVRRIDAQETVTTDEYNFVMAYTLTRLIFSNGARAEYGYKAKRKSLVEHK